MEKREPSREIYETPEEEVDFDKLNEQRGSSHPSQNEHITTDNLQIDQIFLKYSRVDASLSAFKENPNQFSQSEDIYEEFNRLYLDYQLILEEMRYLQSKRQNDPSADQVVRDIKGLEEKISEIAMTPGFELKKDRQHIVKSNLQYLEKEIQRQITDSVFQEIQDAADQIRDSDTQTDMKYEIYLNMEGEPLEELMTEQKVHSRLCNLEKIVGQNTQNQIKASLPQRVETLEKNCATISEGQFKEQAKKISHINFEMDEIIERYNDIITNSEDFQNVLYQHQINSLFHHMTLCVGTQQELGQIVQRLEVLQNLHGQGVEIREMVAGVEAEEQQIDALLEENEHLLTNVWDLYQIKGTLQTDLMSFKDDIVKFDKRLLI